MAYPYFGGWQPQQCYPQPMPDQLAQLRQMQAPPQPQAQPQSGILWVQGEEGAKGYMVAPGSTVLLMDSDAERFYLKSVDASGMPQPLRVFDYQERTAGHKTPPAASQAAEGNPVTRAEFDALARLVAEIGGKTLTITKEETDNG